jgi:hypothetical protein
VSNAIPLPPSTNVKHYEKLAGEFQQAAKAREPGEVRQWAARFLEEVARLRNDELPPHAGKAMERRWEEFAKAGEGPGRRTLRGAQRFLAREHGFASWPKFVRHIEHLSRRGSPVAAFEAGADAVVNGDVTALKELLRDHPGLARQRSTREHRSTLLHYVSANGVEDYRQKTPPNIVEIAKVLLEAGAEVDAESDAYGGGTTALGLAATSIHPERAGVQIALLQTLLDHGARLDHPSAAGNRHNLVTGCIANGQPKAAGFLAAVGAPLDLPGAAALG